MSTIDLISENLYWDFLKKGYITPVKYLNVLGYRTSYKYELGWIGWDRKKQGNKFRVLRLNSGHLLSIVHAQYLGEAFVMFVTLRTKKDNYNTGIYRNYVVAHYVPQDDGTYKEHIAYWGPRGSMKGKIEKLFKDYSITEANCQEYMIRLYRGDFGLQPYECNIYFHDVDLPPIDKDAVISYDKKGYLHIRHDAETGNESDLFTPCNGKSPSRVWQSDREKTTAEMLVKSFIPLQLHRPAKDIYIDWFMRYLKCSYEDAQKLYERRWEVRLP